MSRGWAKASACRLQMTLSCAVLCHIVSLQYLSRSSLHRLAGLPCRLFLSYGLQAATREVHWSSLRRLICPAQEHFIFSHSVDYIYEFCPLPDPDVGPSIFVCDVEHTSFHFGLCGRKFVLYLFGQCPGLCAICHSWQHTGVVHLSLQADGYAAFEDISVFGVCRPACHGSSLYLFVLVLFRDAVVLSQVHVAWDIFYQHIVHVYRGVVYKHHLCLCDVHLKTHSSTFIGFSCSICCSCCGVSVHRNMSSAKRILERNSPSIFTPLFSQFNILNMLSNVAWVRWCPPVLLLS